MTAALLASAILVALALAAFCAGAETGFFSVTRGRITHLAREGSKAAAVLQRALADKSYTLTALLVGNNLAAVAFSSASAALAANIFPDSAVARTVWGACAAFAMLAFGEFLPKLFYAARPLRRMLRLAPAYRVFRIVMMPLTAVASFLTGLFAPATLPREHLTPDDLLRILKDRKDGVKLTEFESALIGRILVLRLKNAPVTVDSILSALDETD